jgi:hypothetical protein
MPVQLATLQLATLQLATLQLVTLQLATLQLATISSRHLTTRHHYISPPLHLATLTSRHHYISPPLHFTSTIYTVKNNQNGVLNGGLQLLINKDNNTKFGTRNIIHLYII